MISRPTQKGFICYFKFRKSSSYLSMLVVCSHLPEASESQAAYLLWREKHLKLLFKELPNLYSYHRVHP